MRVATGPGKVTVLTQPASASGAGLAASLHDFDVDDATVKAEHRRFLDANMVRPQEMKGKTLCERPSEYERASRRATDHRPERSP